MCAFKNEVSISPSPVGFLELGHTGLQSKCSGGLVFLGQESWAGESDMGLRTLSPVGKSLQYNYSPVVGRHPPVSNGT